MKILIVGTGAVGGYYGAKLTQAGHEVVFLARGRTLETLEKNPLVVESYLGRWEVPVTARPDASGLPPQDLIVVCVKSYDTEAVFDLIAPAVGASTVLMSLQNGVENETKLALRFGSEKIIGALCYIGAEMISPGIIRHSARGTVSLGELDGKASDRVEGLVRSLREAGIDATMSPHILKEMWTKLSWNTAFNQVCTLARADVGSVIDAPLLNDLLEDVIREVMAVASAEGILLDSDLVEKTMTHTRHDLRAVRPSMLQDFEKGKKLEHESFSGFLVREGARLGVPTPVNRVLYAFLSFRTKDFF